MAFSSAGSRGTPGLEHWALAVLLSVLLVTGLVRVYRVLQVDTISPTRHVLEGMRTVECGACHMMQYIVVHGRIFVCCSCHSANRVPGDFPRADAQELVASTGPLRKFEFKKGGEHYWQETKQEELEESEQQGAQGDTNIQQNENYPVPVCLGQARSDSNLEVLSTHSSRNGNLSGRMPQCVVCLDAVGCMVLLPCAHGSVCEECTTRIVQNRASGGAHCPHCRSRVTTLVKVQEVDGEVATGVEVRIPMARF